MLCKLVTRIKNKQLVKMSKCLEKHIKIWRLFGLQSGKICMGASTLNFCFTLKNKKEENWRLVCKTKNLKVKWKTESETRSSQLVNDAGSKNYQYSIFVGVSISFLSINEIKKEINITNWEKKKDILGPHAL